VKLNVRWLLSAALVLAPLAAHAQDRTVTTLPRPTGTYWQVSDSQPSQPPASPPPVTLVPQNPPPAPVPIPASPPGPAPGPPPAFIDAPGTDSPPSIFDDGTYPAFGRRVRADVIEAAILFPIVYQNLNAALAVPGVGAFVATLPSSSLGVSAPLIANIQFGLPRWGELNLDYKLLSAEGNSILLGFDPGGGVAFLRSRLDMNVVDLSFAGSGYGPMWNLLWFLNKDPQKPVWGLRWDIGARFETIFYDSTAVGPQRMRHVSDFFVGGGPRVGLTLHRLLGDTGMNLFTRVDVSPNLGSSHQQFSQLDVTAAGAPIGFGYADNTSFRAVTMLSVLAGLGGEALMTQRGRWQVGYQFEEWFNFGSGGGSNADLVTHGLVLRWQYNY
jgi:hypothetical protein